MLPAGVVTAALMSPGAAAAAVISVWRVGFAAGVLLPVTVACICLRHKSGATVRSRLTSCCASCTAGCSQLIRGSVAVTAAHV